jgi:PPOX class probable FMN-dependent enzyme
MSGSTRSTAGRDHEPAPQDRDIGPPMTVPGAITDLAGLEARFRAPSERARTKVFDRIDASSARFIDICPFLVLATTNGTSVDASPRGGPPGFIRRLDDRHVAIPDLVGNNRLDSFRNIVAHPWAGLLLLIPGKDETLRINGRATVSADPALLESMATRGRRPTVAVVVATDELYGHCALAFRRAQLWQPDTWAALSTAPDLADIYTCQFGGIDARAMRLTIDEIYDRDLTTD